MATCATIWLVETWLFFFFHHFQGRCHACCSVVDTRWIMFPLCLHLLAAPNSSPGTPQEFRWHRLMLTLVSAFLQANIKPASSQHKAPFPPVKPVTVAITGKLRAARNLVCRSSLLTSLPALAVYYGTLAATVTWCCHLVLHTSTQISQQTAVLTNGDFTLSNKSAPRRRLLIGLASRHCRGIFRKKMEQLLTILVVLGTGMFFWGLVAFSDANLAIFTSLLLSNYCTSSVLGCPAALHLKRAISFATTSLHVSVIEAPRPLMLHMCSTCSRYRWAVSQCPDWIFAGIKVKPSRTARLIFF